MKFKFFSLVAISAVVVTLQSSPMLTVFAENNPDSILLLENDRGRIEKISPRFTYIQSADIGVYPGKTETKYSMNIRGIAEVTGVTGTMTLYKKASNGTYEEKESKEIDLDGSEIQCKGSFKSYGSSI